MKSQWIFQKCPSGHGRLRLQDRRAVGTSLGILGAKIKNEDDERAGGLLREKAEAPQQAENTAAGTFQSREQGERNQHGVRDKSEKGVRVLKAAVGRLEMEGSKALQPQRSRGGESAIPRRGPTLGFARTATVPAGMLWHAGAHRRPDQPTPMQGWAAVTLTCNAKAASPRLTAETCLCHVA